MLEIATHSLLRHAMRWDLFLYQLAVKFSLNVDFAFFVYSHQSVGITSEYHIYLV